MALASNFDPGCETKYPGSHVHERVGKTPLIRRPGRDLPQREFTPVLPDPGCEENPDGRVGSLNYIRWQY